MKTTKLSLSLWTIWAPLKLGLIISLFGLIIMFAYSLITSHIYNTPSQVPETPLFLLLLIGFLLAIYLVIRKLPEIKMDRKSFVAIHSLQIITLNNKPLFLTECLSLINKCHIFNPV